MSGVDYAIIGMFVLSAALGWFRGFLREAITLLAWIFALWAAWTQSDWVVPYLNSGVLAQPPLQIWAARAIVFLGVILLGSALAAIIGHFVHTSIFSILDRILGFAFGALRGALILGVLVMAAQFLRLDQQPWWKKSQLLPYGESFATVVRAWVGEARLTSVAPVPPAST